MSEVVLPPADRAQLVNWIMDDEALKQTVVRLVRRGKLTGSSQAVTDHPWNVLVPYGLATIEAAKNAPHLDRWVLRPTDVAIEVHQTHLVDEALRKEEAGLSKP